MHESKGMVRSYGPFHFVAVVAIVLFVCLRQSHCVALTWNSEVVLSSASLVLFVETGFHSVAGYPETHN